MEVKTSIITRSKDLPELCKGTFFHSRDLFCMLEQIPRLKPCMVVATDENGETIGQILAQIRVKRRILGINFTRRARVYSEGCYQDGIDNTEKGKLFDAMTDALVHHLLRHRCYHIELSDISKKMFGYRTLRKHGFVPIPWIQVHHSLHSRAPEERASEKVLQRVKRALENGFETRSAMDKAEIHQLYRLIKRYYILRKQRYIPHEELFQQIGNSAFGHVYVTLYKGRMVGGSVVVDSGRDSMLWFDAAMEKRYILYHPHTLTVWYAIKEAHRRKQDHIHILNLGLPFSRSKYRDFILSFGGKPVSSYRWFRFSNSLMRRFMFWYYQI
ncbi:GNAT family N-acetyltransferase [Prevotella nigrescens]|uniref:GNAT family N-acetyltransferase n=1 Tax=Prevotella nigrescens TaxID=28133 RepID=UPI0028F11CA5|nr:GNAT family N-acetyltransferase [Prevotella nigrescens]